MRLTITDDGGAVTVLPVDTRDLSRFRDVQEREGWGDLEADPIRGAQGVAYCAARRLHVIEPDLSLDLFRDRYQVAALDDEGDVADPTSPGPSPG